MSELKGMIVFAVSEPLEDGRFFIKKSILDGSLAIFDEEKDADSQLRRNGIQGNVVNELIVVRAERAANVNSELEALTEINRLQSEENKQLAEDNAKLREALAGLKLDSIKVIDSLVNTGCGEAWSIIKLNNMITDIEDALKTECTTCDNSNEAEEFKQLQQDKAELREALESLFCSIDDDLTCCMNERKLQIIGHLLEKHKCN